MRRAIYFLCFVFVVAAPFACESEAEEKSTGGVPTVPCDREEDCETANPCRQGFCNVVAGECSFTLLDGEVNPEAMQVQGDCQDLGCINGEEAILFVDGDTPQDNNNDCNTIICVDGVQTPEFLMAGERCDFIDGRGRCNDMGVCSCMAGAPGDEHFVDPVEGTDAPNQGGDRGACAYRTLTYALTQANGPIRLAAAEYSAATGETLPFVLTGGQQLECFDFSNDMRASIVGSGTYGNTTVTIALEGTDNDLDRCDIRGSGAAHCVNIVGDGVAADHDLQEVDISGCASGITQTAAADGLDLNNSSVHDNSVTGVDILGMQKSVEIDNNIFANNGMDVQCADLMPNVQGGGNQLTTCQGCENCNF